MPRLAADTLEIRAVAVVCREVILDRDTESEAAAGGTHVHPAAHHRPRPLAETEAAKDEGCTVRRPNGFT